MKITMVETRRGSEDGFTVRRYEEGQTYEVADLTARAFLKAGWAVRAIEAEVVAQNLEAARSTITPEDTIPAFNPAKFSFSDEPMGTDELMKEIYTECLKQAEPKEMGHA